MPDITGSDGLSQARLLGRGLSQMLVLVPRMSKVTPGMERLVLYCSACSSSWSGSEGLPARNHVQVQLVHGKGSQEQSPFRNELYWKLASYCPATVGIYDSALSLQSAVGGWNVTSETWWRVK